MGLLPINIIFLFDVVLCGFLADKCVAYTIKLYNFGVTCSCLESNKTTQQLNTDSDCEVTVVS